VQAHFFFDSVFLTMALPLGKTALCAQFFILGAQAEGNFTSELLDLDMCPGSNLIYPPQEWAWSFDNNPCPSCQSPPTQNLGRMCAGDPTSVVIENGGKPSCLRTAMPDCEMDMHAVKQIDFDLRLRDCGSTWAAPLWLTPDIWRSQNGGPGHSGELDLAELCPVGEVWSNFAGAKEPMGYQKQWHLDPNWFAGHVTMWNHGGAITVKMCDEEERDSNGGSCRGDDDLAYYPKVYDSNGCTIGNCRYTMVSDIWNGYSGDSGFVGCTKGYPQPGNCKTSVRNIRIKGPQFYGKCAALNAWNDEVEVV